MKTVLVFSFFVAALSGGPAWAACQYNGVYYETGAQLCFGGWLQECTVADYWKAIGTCKAPEPAEPVVENDAFDVEALIAKALGTYRNPDPRQSLIR